MMHLAAPAQQSARLNTTHQALGQWLAELLMLDQARPRRCARMCEPTAPEKYKDIPKNARFTLGNLLDHARARVTWSCTLDQNGLSSAGVIEIDAGGRDALVRTLAACERRGIVAFAFEQLSTDHSGGHVWVLFSEPAPVADILALCRAIAADAGLPDDTELWPQNQGIRAPFGFHQRNQTRGNLVLQSGELIALDMELAAGFAAVHTLPRNSAPPAAPVEKPEHTAPKVLTLTPRQNTGRASLDDVKARFAAEHTLENLLTGYGAEETKDGYTCPFCTHTHETTLYIGKLGRLFSYSPNCKLYTTKGWDAFGLYVLIEHNNDVIAAARALNPTEPRQRQPEPAEPERHQQTPAQAADAARKRAQRATEAAEIRASIEQAASQDARLSDSAQLVLLGLLEIAGNRAWCRPSVARLVKMLDISERSVFYGLNDLARYGYIANSQAPGRTTVRTFLRVQADPAETGALHPDLDIYTDLFLTMGASEGGAQDPEPPARGEGDTLDTWQAADDCHGAAELLALDQAAGASYPHPAIEPSGEYTGRSKHEVPDRIRSNWANEAIRVIEAATGDEPAPQALPVAPACSRARRPRGGISASDRYRADVALMDEYRLVGEIKKHTATLKKHAGAMWLDQVRAKLALVQAEIDERAGGAVARSVGQLQGGTVPIRRARAGNRPPSQARAAQPRPDRMRQMAPSHLQSLDMFAQSGAAAS